MSQHTDQQLEQNRTFMQKHHLLAYYSISDMMIGNESTRSAVFDKMSVKAINECKLVVSGILHFGMCFR